VATSFVRKIEESNIRLYELRIPFADGRIGYYKLSIDPLKEAGFHKACKTGATVDLMTFGTILESYFLPSHIPVLDTASV
jgi:hypothetical protein